MAVALLNQIPNVRDTGSGYEVDLLYSISEGTQAEGPATVTLAVDLNPLGMRGMIADAIEAHALQNFNMTIDQFPQPVPTRRAILFLDGTWAGL